MTGEGAPKAAATTKAVALTANIFLLFISAPFLKSQTKRTSFANGENYIFTTERGAMREMYPLNVGLGPEPSRSVSRPLEDARRVSPRPTLNDHRSIFWGVGDFETCALRCNKSPRPCRRHVNIPSGNSFRPQETHSIGKLSSPRQKNS